MDAFEIRLARADEYAVVGDLTVAAYDVDGFLEGADGYAEQLRSAAERAAGAELWVAADRTGVLGTVTYCPPGSGYRELATASDQGEFRMLAVAPTARRGGIGRALVAHCIARSRAAGHRELLLCSSTPMRAAHRLYETFGFVRAPELDWYPRPRIRLLGFRLPLTRRSAPSDPAIRPV